MPSKYGHLAGSFSQTPVRGQGLLHSWELGCSIRIPPTLFSEEPLTKMGGQVKDMLKALGWCPNGHLQLHQR